MKVRAFSEKTKEFECEVSTEWVRDLGNFLDWAVEGDFAYIENVADEDVLDDLIIRLKNTDLSNNTLQLTNLEITTAHSILHIYQTVHESAFKDFPKSKYVKLLEDFIEIEEQCAAYKDQGDGSYA